MNRINLRWYHLFALILTGFLVIGCDGSDGAAGAAGAAGPAGPPGADGPPGTGIAPIDQAKAESCATCHDDVGKGEHQSIYDKYAGSVENSAFDLTITDVSSTPNGTVPETWDATMTIHLEKDGVPVSGLHSFTTSWGATVWAPTGVDQASFYTVQYISGTQTFDNSNSFSMNGTTSDPVPGSGNFLAMATGVAFDPVPVNGQAYAYVVGGLLDTEGMHLYENVTNTAIAYGDVGTYASAANVEGCEACHGKPYLKHGYRDPIVNNLPNFASCKSCHYDDRTGGHEDWQYMVDDPVNWSAAGLPTAEVETKYAYKAKLMNVVHMAHAMEFPFPRSMANCNTCHAGKLTSPNGVLTNTNFTAETCKSCHPVQGLEAWPADAGSVLEGEYAQDERAPPLEYLWTKRGVESFHDISQNCQACHGAGVAPAFDELHSGYDVRITNDAGVKYRDLYTASIDDVSLAGDVLTISYNADESAITNAVAGTLDVHVYVSFYGWDSKHFIVPSHTRDGSLACSGGARGCRFEVSTLSYSDDPASSSYIPLFPSLTEVAPGSWELTVDMAAWVDGQPGFIPDLIADGTIKKAQITLASRLDVDIGRTYRDSTDTEVMANLDAVTQTFDLGAGAFVADYFKGSNAVVDETKCEACHDQLAVTWHTGRGRGGDIMACKNCHNPTYTGSHVEMASRSVENYVHAIHSFQDFDPGDTFEVFDAVLAKRYDQHVQHIFPNFTAKNCEACHRPGTYNVPDQSKSIPGVLSASDDVATWYEMVSTSGKIPSTIAAEVPAGRNISGSIPEMVTGPASRACGGCHRAQSIKADAAGDLASWNAHTEAGGTFVENDAADTILFAVIDKIMSLFE